MVFSPCEQALYAILRDVAREPLRFRRTPLEQALGTLSVSNDLAIAMDPDLSDTVPPDTPVTADLEGLSLASALRRILVPLQATYYVQDEVVHVTTVDGAADRQVQRVYDVSDLAQGEYLVRCSDGTPANADVIAEMLVESVAPTCWDVVGGPGSAEGFAARSCVVVLQTEAVHEQVADFLVGLRQGSPGTFRTYAIPAARGIERARERAKQSLGGGWAGSFGCYSMSGL